MPRGERRRYTAFHFFIWAAPPYCHITSWNWGNEDGVTVGFHHYCWLPHALRCPSPGRGTCLSRSY